MTDPKSTKLTIREDKAASISSSAQGAHVDAIGFNILFIAERNPKLALEIMKLFNEAQAIEEDAPRAPEEDFALFTERMFKLLDTAEKRDEL